MKPRFCIAALALMVLPAVSATQAASREVDRAACDSKDAAACTRLTSIVPDESKRCRIGMRADIKGTLVDIKRDNASWSVGSTTYIDTCSGLVDPSTGSITALNPSSF